jgi:hypothetical protein
VELTRIVAAIAFVMLVTARRMLMLVILAPVLAALIAISGCLVVLATISLLCGSCYGSPDGTSKVNARRVEMNGKQSRR